MYRKNKTQPINTNNTFTSSTFMNWQSQIYSKLFKPTMYRNKFGSFGENIHNTVLSLIGEL